MPVFARIVRRHLFLTEVSVTSKMALALHDYLRHVKNIPSTQIETVTVDDCGMDDNSLAILLNGLKEQGVYLKRIIYSNNASIGR